MIEVREVGEAELPRFVAMRAVWKEADTVEGFLDWRRPARETVWLAARSEVVAEPSTAVT